eukprot:gene16924-18630_t
MNTSSLNQTYLMHTTLSPTKQHSPTVYVWYRVILASIIALSVPMNVMVIAQIILKKQSVQKTTRYILIASMAFSDVLQAMVGYVFQMVAIQMDDMKSIFCQVSGFTITFFALASMNHIIVLSIDSYMHVCQPWLVDRNRFDRKKTYAIYIVPSWLYAFIWSIVPLILWDGYDAVERGNCSLKWDTDIYLRKSYIISMLVFCFLIPTIIMLTCFTLTQIGLNKMRSFAVDRFGSQSVEVLENKRAEKRHFTTSFIIASMFLFAWSPYAFLSILQVVKFHATKTNIFRTFLVAASLLSKSSVIYNPIIYVTRIRSKGDNDALANSATTLNNKQFCLEQRV